MSDSETIHNKYLVTWINIIPKGNHYEYTVPPVKACPAAAQRESRSPCDSPSLDGTTSKPPRQTLASSIQPKPYWLYNIQTHLASPYQFLTPSTDTFYEVTIMPKLAHLPLHFPPNWPIRLVRERSSRNVIHYHGTWGQSKTYRISKLKRHIKSYAWTLYRYKGKTDGPYQKRYKKYNPDNTTLWKTYNSDIYKWIDYCTKDLREKKPKVIVQQCQNTDHIITDSNTKEGDTQDLKHSDKEDTKDTNGE